MQDFLAALGISVLSSVLTVLLLWVGKLIVERLVADYGFRLALAHVQDVSGLWYGENPDRDGSIMRERVQLNQMGNRLTGELQYEYLEPGRVSAKLKKFRINGILRNDVISLYYYNMNRREKGSGAICLRVSEDGDSLVGKWAWWDTKLEAVESSTASEILRWTRTPVSNNGKQGDTFGLAAAPRPPQPAAPTPDAPPSQNAPPHPARTGSDGGG